METETYIQTPFIIEDTHLFDDDAVFVIEAIEEAELIVSVSAKNITSGKRGDPGDCAIAQAVKRDPNRNFKVLDSNRQVKEHISMGADGVLRIGGLKYYSYEAIDWVHRFDANEPVEPTTFKFLRIADELQPVN